MCVCVLMWCVCTEQKQIPGSRPIWVTVVNMRTIHPPHFIKQVAIASCPVCPYRYIHLDVRRTSEDLQVKCMYTYMPTIPRPNFIKQVTIVSCPVCPYRSLNLDFRLTSEVYVYIYPVYIYPNYIPTKLHKKQVAIASCSCVSLYIYIYI